ncbi:hypothetical protein VTI28DRAFT_2424 [Corynascus sepedonium]
MGSNGPASTPAPPPPSFPLDSLPDADSPLLVLTQPTHAERVATIKHTYRNWGFALTEPDYVAREAYLTTVPLARDGGITHWILTVASLPPDRRPILSSCESLRKRAISCRRRAAGGGGDDDDPDGGKGVADVEIEVVEGVAHGIGSVFTEPAYRGKGYASRMMKEVGERLRAWQGQSLFSVLYSDIGKSFYARHGWPAYESLHVSFKPAVVESAGDNERTKQVARAIGYHELAELCAVDEKLLRADLARRCRGDSKTHVAILPELDAMLWHLMREDYMTKSIFGKTPTVRGAVVGEPGKRVWAVWTRGYYGGLKKPEGNVLHVLRVVVEDPEQPDEELVEGFRSIVQMAQHEAAEWKTQDVQVWNPPSKLKSLVQKCGIKSEFVVREKDSIASLRWYGNEPAAEVDWVANEKYAWC